ncbi:hypothetical protein ENSA5_28460 [Enhygromyxa salina]|uniref:Lipoprotein n=1 Tax=Enhygromyxa salina TaxID=215803 RepID=A0A2S9Y4M7_9BACT|nr:hypothetical protein [Enhygromyxa salina]PRQ00032.1 hypothetical protein ENSA5_28460 [Enhygromyxa salina]
MVLSRRAASLLCVGLLACKPSAGEAETESATKSGGPTPEASAASFVPLEPGPGRFVSANKRVAVPTPTGEGWECLEEEHGDDQAAAVALRCRREDPREFLFVAAKTHRQPVDQRTDAHTVLMSLYRADNEAFFDHVEYTSDHAVTLAGAPGWEAELVAEHARLGTIRKRERLAIVGDRVFAISAEGAPALWDAHAEEIERWFANVEFAPDN